MDLHPVEPLARSRIADLPAVARDAALPLACLPRGRRHHRSVGPMVRDPGHSARLEEVWLVEHIESPSGGSEGMTGRDDPFEHPRTTPDVRTGSRAAWYSGRQGGTTTAGLVVTGGQASRGGRRIRRRETLRD